MIDDVIRRIVNIIQRIAKLPRYRLELQNVGAKMGVNSPSKTHIRCIADLVGEGQPGRQKYERRCKQVLMGEMEG